MSVTASTIYHEFQTDGLFLDMAGADVPVAAAAPVETCGPGDLVFVDDEKQAALAAERRPALVVTRPDFATRFPGSTVITARNVKLAHARVRQKYFDRDLRAHGWPRIHPSAVIHDTARVAPTAHIGPGTVIGREARIGERCVLMSNVVVEEGAVVEEDSVLHPSVVLGYGCRVGKRVIIRSGTVVGSEGFGFAQDERRKSHRIPQTGNVVIGDRVVIGANCCIDRATYGSTRIGAGTIMDNLCHIAHNVEIGEDCILTAFLCVAGSSRIGSRVVASGQTGILDHVTVGDDVVLVQRAGVANDVTDPGIYAGAPLLPLNEYRRNAAVLKNLTELRAAVKTLEKQMAALHGGSRTHD